ncbi:DUF350 domain-containing protein [Roseiconus nitratireducens]|uniref:DUF350 domain-containing protein n=1 Tax=Roseiconus nitratireducens TaxID=2605748 RepID=A0A5M6DHY6_9BACT|nr:DUF350 domain-containing protein [Roseiconus nitratireducens]KAA5545976.1 DUF350 domain-containing protein [Roseiconus nitratireducens]
MTGIDVAMILAQEQVPSRLSLLGGHLLAAVIFSVVGIIVFAVCLLILEKITPFSILREIGEEHNQAVATIIGAIILGISIIIGAAVLG